MKVVRRSLLVVAIALLSAGTASAQFTTVDLSGVTNSSFTGAGTGSGDTYPYGAVTLGGIPFLIDQTSGGSPEARGWFAFHAPGPNPRSVTVNPNVFGVTSVYTLINTFWGVTGPTSYASLTFNGSAGAVFTYALVGDADIRDYNQFFYTNTINGTTTVNVFDNGNGQRLDRQQIDLPGVFASQTLTSITLDDNGGDGVQRVFLAGVTVQAPGVTSTPEPGTLTLLASGLLGVGLVGRRRRA